MDAARWTFVYACVGMPFNPERLDAASFRYPIPAPPGKVGYLLCSHTAPIVASGMTGIFELAGDGAVVDAAEPWGEICTARFVIVRDFSTARGRWWSRPILLLNAMKNSGAFQLTSTFQPQDWTGVNGERAEDFLTDFRACLAAPQSLGITHGAADAGHGVACTGGTLKMMAREIRLT